MKKWFACALTVLIVAMAVPALADVTATVVITKEKDIFVTEQLFKVKQVFIDVVTELLLDGATEVEAIVNVSNTDNIMPDLDSTNYGIQRSAELGASVNDNSGILGLNQDVGNMVNQANVVSFGLTEIPDAFADAQAAADQRNTGNTVFQNNSDTFDPEVPDRTATIDGSINNNSGIVGVNQNAGNMNNQTNAVAVAVAMNGIVALSEAALGQVNVGNEVCEIATNKLDLIADSITGNAGIVSVNQSSGNMNNQGAVLSMAVRTSTVNLSSIPGQ